jgi:hypothetical protein
MEHLFTFVLVSTAITTCLAFGVLAAWLSVEGMFHLMNKSQFQRELDTRR